MIKLQWRDVPIKGGSPISTSISEAETAALRELAGSELVGLEDALEVGSAYGYSAIVMALAGALVTAVDPHVWLNSAGTMRANLAAYDVADKVMIVQRSSHEALPAYVADGWTFGLIFVDGDHDEAAVDHDVSWAVKLLAPGGVLAAHDYDEATCPGVRAALDRLLGPPPELVDTLAVYRDLT